MNEAGVDWNFHDHSGTLTDLRFSTLGSGHLHESSDRRSTMNMLSLFREIFPGVPQSYVARNAVGTAIPV